MPKFVQKALSFPLAGVSRRGNYRDQSRPYSAPWAVNVRGIAPLENRHRGGSRPGFVKVIDQDFGDITAVVPVTSVDSAGVRHQDLVVVADGSLSFVRGTVVTAPSPNLTDDSDNAILTDDGQEIIFSSEVNAVLGPRPVLTTDSGEAIVTDDGEEVFFSAASGAFDAVERGGWLYLADTVLRRYNPATGIVEDVRATAGTVPAGMPLVCLYRDRVFLSGSDHVWYASRQGDPSDWDLAGDMNDVGRAVAGQVDRAGRIGDAITAMIAYGDSHMLFASRNGLWMLRGDPTDGSMIQVSNEIGVLSPSAWVRSPDGTVAFLSADGVYVSASGSADHPRRWSEERVPDGLRNVDPDGNSIVMGYDPRGRGFHLFITPTDGSAGSQWWLDFDNKAIWPVHLSLDHEPVAAARMQGAAGMSDAVFACRDGYLRRFSDTAAQDDGLNVSSHVLIGPFPLTGSDTIDAVLNELHGTLADNTAPVTWRVVMGLSAEDAADKAAAGISAALAGQNPSGVSASGVWDSMRNRVSRPRARGPWAVVWLSSIGRWAYESVSVGINQLGRLR